MKTADVEELMRVHDAEPDKVAQALANANFSAIADTDAQALSWLVNHVVGEKLGRWGHAVDLHRSLRRGRPQAGLALNMAAAAHAAGMAITAWGIESEVVAATDLDVSLVRSAIRLRTMQFTSAGANCVEFARALDEALAPIDPQSVPRGFAATLAAVLNNVVSLLLDRGDLDAADTLQARALRGGADKCRLLWKLAGNWLNHERADYLVALSANRTGEWEVAAAAARSGLGTIAANEPEPVDEAFLLLELSRASRELSYAKEADEAARKALALAAQFDAGLKEWFDSRAAAALRAVDG